MFRIPNSTLDAEADAQPQGRTCVLPLWAPLIPLRTLTLSLNFIEKN